MIILTLETEHYHFEGAGKTTAEARKTLDQALLYHADQHRLMMNWWHGHYEIKSLEIEPGECFRDSQLLYRAPAAGE